MEPSLDLQKAVRNRLVAASAVTSIIPATAIVDRNATPALDHSIVIGEAMTGPDDGLARTRHSVVFDLHVWRKEPGLAGVKQVVGAIRDALNDGPLILDHHHVAGLRIASTRFLRDPGGLHSHAVLSLECRLVEFAS